MSGSEMKMSVNGRARISDMEINYSRQYNITSLCGSLLWEGTADGPAGERDDQEALAPEELTMQ